MNTKTIALVLVAILVIGGVGAFLVMNDDGEEERINAPDTALVYGNANNDYAIDSLDVDVLQDIVDGKTTWDSDKNYLADANNDGKITQADIDLVNKIINNEKCNVYYQNHFDDAQEISYPQKDKRIAVTYWQQAEEAAILGLWDNVVMANSSVEGRGQLYDLSNVKFFGNSSGAGVDSAAVEMMLQEKVELVICSAYSNLVEVMEPLRDKGIEAIYLWHGGEKCFSTVLTTGILTDTEEQAEKYLAYKADVEKYIADKVPEKSKQPTMVITMLHYGKADKMYSGWGGIFTSVGEPSAEWRLLQQLCNVYTADVVGQPSQGRNFYSIEWFVQNPHDYIMVMGSGVKAPTQADYDTWFETDMPRFYEKTTAYENGNMLGTTFGFGGFSAYSLMPIMAWMVYPDLFTLEDGEELRQYYYDNFTDKAPDIHDVPAYYLGDGYAASYLQ